MFKNRWIKVVLLSLVLMVGVGSYAAFASTEEQAAAEVLVFEIAENPTRLVFDDSPLHEDGFPAYGNEFISQGYIYPEGTLNGSNGVLENGDPEFPDKVIGEWTCRGWHVGDGGHTTTGFWAMTTQTYHLYDENVIIVTDGYESPEIGRPVARAIVGGTGKYATARGEQMQEMLGFTEWLSINVRVEITVRN
jgi:hypothetical protein